MAIVCAAKTVGRLLATYLVLVAFALPLASAAQPLLELGAPEQCGPGRCCCRLTTAPAPAGTTCLVAACRCCKHEPAAVPAPGDPGELLGTPGLAPPDSVSQHRCAPTTAVSELVLPVESPPPRRPHVVAT